MSKKILIMNNLTYLDWDTNFFGYKIGEVSNLSDNILDSAKDQNYRLLYLKLNPNNNYDNYVNVLKKGILVDEKVTYMKNIEKISTQDNFDVEIYSDNFVSKELYYLAQTILQMAFHYFCRHCKRPQIHK